MLCPPAPADRNNVPTGGQGVGAPGRVATATGDRCVLATSFGKARRA